MAKGTAGGRAGWVVAGLIVLVVLVSTNVWNPFPELWDWVSRTRPLASPNTVWQQSVGGVPKSVTITGSVAIVEQRSSVESRSLATGAQLWKRDVDWGAVAGEGDNASIVVGELLTKGYEVLDPRSGIVRRKDTEAVAVWTYRDALLDVRCADAQDCTLSAWEPRGTSPRWTTELPGVGFVLFADNPDLLDAKPLTARGIAGDVAGPVVLPPLLGFPIDQKVRAVDTSDGRIARDFEPDRDDRYAVVGGRLIRVQARSGDGTCYFTVTATDAATDRQVWQKEALNLRTVSGAGCVQRNDPNGGQNVVVGVAANGREVVVDAYDGRVLWLGKQGEKLQAVDDSYAIVRPPDGKSVVSYAYGSSRARWTKPVHDGKAQTAITPYAVVTTQEDPHRITAWAPATGKELATVKSEAKVWAVGPAGMIIGEGRQIGYIPFAGATSTPNGTGAPAGGGVENCDGPKEPRCRAEK